MRLPIETERLRLRKYQDGDVKDIVEYSSRADYWLARNLDWEPTEEGVKAYYESRRDVSPESYPDWLNLVIELKAESKVVGNVGIGVKNKEQGQAEVGWLLGRQYQGRGIATEAVKALLAFGFGPMGLHRIYARTGNRNTRSWRLMEKVGMRREAHFRQSHQVKGEWDDEFIYAVLADEWRAMNTEDSNSQTGWDEEISRLFIDYGRYFVPERDHQMQVIAALLSHLAGPCIVLELCCGEGLLAEILLDSFPTFTVYGLDGSAEMLRRAQERLARFESRFRYSQFDLASPDWRKPEFPVKAIVSSLAIHHLTGPQKQELFVDAHEMLANEGLLVIADIVDPQTEAGKHVAADTWDRVVQKQSLDLSGNTEALDFFKREGWNTFRYLDPEDIDKPSPLFDQLKWLEEAGFVDVDVHWMLAGHAVFSARKHTDSHMTP